MRSKWICRNEKMMVIIPSPRSGVGSSSEKVGGDAQAAGGNPSGDKTPRPCRRRSRELRRRRGRSPRRGGNPLEPGRAGVGQGLVPDQCREYQARLGRRPGGYVAAGDGRGSAAGQRNRFARLRACRNRQWSLPDRSGPWLRKGAFPDFAAPCSPASRQPEPDRCGMPTWGDPVVVARRDIREENGRRSFAAHQRAQRLLRPGKGGRFL